MPLVFIHGVNTRDTDEDYARSVAARRTMFEQLVVPTVVKQGFPTFSVASDIYWGNLGVSFGWGLRTIPDTQVLQSLGAASGSIQNIDLMELVSASRPASKEVESLGSEPLLVAAAKKDPGALVRAVFAPEAERFAPREMSPPKPGITKMDLRKAALQGEHLGLLLIAVGELARDVQTTPELIQGKTDDEVTNKIQQEVQVRYQARAQARLDAEASQETEHLGKFGDAIGWAMDHLKGAVNAVKKAAGTVLAETERGASLLALKELRQGISSRGLRFLGDVFVYLHHGRTAAPAIYDCVKNGVTVLNTKSEDKGKREPLIVVTHSFGSEILYDLLTSGALKDVMIDLWVTVGAQTSLFAEMRLFSAMPPLPPDTSKFVLGRPENVKKWINFYDAADMLSFLHEPVFGQKAVKDIEVTAQGNLTNAHGHYFADPGFYERIAAEI